MITQEEMVNKYYFNVEIFSKKMLKVTNKIIEKETINDKDI